MFCLSCFVYKNEDLYDKVLKEIVVYLEIHKNEFIDIQLETEEGLKI